MMFFFQICQQIYECSILQITSTDDKTKKNQTHQTHHEQNFRRTQKQKIFNHFCAFLSRQIYFKIQNCVLFKWIPFKASRSISEIAQFCYFLKFWHSFFALSLSNSLQRTRKHCQPRSPHSGGVPPLAGEAVFKSLANFNKNNREQAKLKFNNYSIIQPKEQNHWTIHSSSCVSHLILAEL